jgi:hypothetical protein
LILAIFLISPGFSDTGPLAAKSYVDGAIASLGTMKGDKGDKGDQGIQGPPGVDGINIPIWHTAANGVATNGVVSITVPDGIQFKATKQSNTNYWALRMVNNSAQTITFSERGFHQYSGNQTGRNTDGTLAPGAEVNPDNESGDVGYSRGDVYNSWFADFTNGHLYRWTVSVYINNIMMSVEQLH